MDTGRPEEVTVIVYRGRNLQGKKKGRGKFHVVFSVGNNKFKSEVIDDPEGNPTWDNEAEIQVDNPQEPLILKVKEKDDIIGQVVIPLAELPTKRTDRQRINNRCVPLQPHKKCPNPQGELVFVAWISRKGAPQHTPDYVSDVKSKSSTLDPGSLASMSSLSGSQASLASTDTKKKSMMKKLKGKLSHSPKLGGRKLSVKSTSMMDLGPQTLSIADPDLRKSNESLNSQESTNSAPKKKSGVARLKQKLGKSPMLGRKLSKSSSKSLSNLNLDPNMKFSAAHGSNESLHSTKSSKSNKSGTSKGSATGSKGLKGLFAKRSSLKPDKPIPAQFDLSKPSSHLLHELEKEEEEYGAVPFAPQEDGGPKKPPRAPPTHSRSGSQSSGGGAEDSPFQRRHNSLKTRKRPDLSHRSPAAVLRHPTHTPEIPPASSPKNRNVFAINADMNEDLWSVEEDESRHKSMIAQSPLLAKSAAITERDEDEGLNPFEEDIKKEPLGQKISTGSMEPKSINPFEDPAPNPFDEAPKKLDPQSTPVLDTPSQKKKIAAPFVFSPSDDEEDEKKPPEISGVSPREGSTEGGTKITIRGEYLGKTKDDIVTLTVCGVNCIDSLEYFSSYKLMCTTSTRRPGSGKIVIETKSGGLARSTIDYIFVQPKQDPPAKPVREHKREKSQPKELFQNFLGGGNKDPSPPKEVMAPKRDDVDTKMAVVEPMSRAKVQSVQGHTRQGSGNGDLKRQAPVPPASRTNNNNTKQITKDSNEDSYQKDDLLRIIRELQTENQKLKEENVTMKTYIDQMVMRVMEKCPDLLAVK